MSNKVNAKHDTATYECCGYQREIFDGNALYDAFLKAKQGSDWKPQVQKYEMAYLLYLGKMQRELRTETYEFLPTTSFTLNERGKIRRITGEQFPDRIVKHSLCDEVITPSVRKYLIYDNSASLEDRGIDFARRRLETHLHKYYNQHGSNDGYILLFDFSKYYDNIWHSKLRELFAQYIDDEVALRLIDQILKRERVDVSYMDDDEYSRCMTTLFNSLEYELVDKKLLTKVRYMEKHLNIGDQLAQDAGIVYPMRIDNFVKIVRAVKFYGRYMDDGYAIHESKEFLEGLLKDIIQIAKELGITVNERKTRICKLSELWRFLQIQYSLTDTGRVIHKINPKRLTTMRRKMKKLAGRLPEKEFDDWYTSWIKNHCRNMSKHQRSNMTELYNKLKEERYHVENHSGRRDRTDGVHPEREQLRQQDPGERVCVRGQLVYPHSHGRRDGNCHAQRRPHSAGEVQGRLVSLLPGTLPAGNPVCGPQRQD